MSSFCFCDSSVGKESPCNAGDPSLIPGSGRPTGEGKGYPVQYSGLENPMDRIVNGVAKCRTQLSDFHFHRYHIKEFSAPVGMQRCNRPGLLRSSLS